MRPALAFGCVSLLIGWTNIVARAGPAARPYSDWSVDPTEPGPNLPPAGRSYFDYLVNDKVPFPFAALEAKIGRRVAVLIPLGRSLQRNAANPDFFRFPRAVIAAASESDGMPLKDRLFLGFQEKAGILEVISYNEAAGRFEFQLVTDYRPGGSPRVSYANRAVCTACHQNHAPIFPRQLWDESNANPKIAELLSREKTSFYGIPVDRGVDVPYAIDNAVARANTFSSTQLLWREACGDSQPCREAALAAALQFKLSGERYYDTSSTGYLSASKTVAEHWRARWPHGLHIPGSSIPNRDPLVSASQRTGRLLDELILRQAAIETRFEPAIRRSALETWAAEQAMPRLISGLAEFITSDDTRALDQALAAAHNRASTFTLGCKSFMRGRASRMDRVEFRCTAGDRALDALFYVRDGNVTRGTVAKLSRGNGEVRDLRIGRASIASRHSGYLSSVPLLQKDIALHARQADGNMIRSIQFAWSFDGAGFATVTVNDDFAPVLRGLSALSPDILSANPFRRAVTIRGLFQQLGMKPGHWCCMYDLDLQPPRVATR